MKMLLNGGIYLDLDYIRPELFTIEAIAHGLARECRFGGHIRPWHYSVAQHSVIVSRHVSPANAMWGLLHDASEGVIKDIPKPVKMKLPDYAALERRVMMAICDRFGLPREEPADVTLYDRIVCETEQRDLRDHPGGFKPHPEFPPLRETIIARSAEESFHAFLARYDEIHGGAR